MEDILLQWFYSGKSGVVWLVAFVAGLLSFLSPCILPLVPAYISYISGVSLEQLDSRKLARHNLRVAIVGRACLFVLGFSLVFVGVGLALSSVISVLQSPITNVIAGGIVVVFGVHFLGLWRFGLLDRSARYEFALRHKALEILAPFVLGISFALGYTPCTGAIFGAITLLVGTGGYGAGLLVMYACGLAVPFLLVALILERGFSLLARIKPFMRWIELISGGILVAMGALIMSGELGTLSAWLVS